MHAAVMWCRICQQDVPGVLTSDASRVCCPRCYSTLSSGAATESAATLATGCPETGADSNCESSKTDDITGGDAFRVSTMPPLLDLDDWQFDDDVRTVRRVLQSLGQRTVRIDSAHPQGHNDPVAQPHFPPDRAAASKNDDERDVLGSKHHGSTGTSQWFAWLLMAMGLSTFVCGAALLGWYFYDGREQLWRMGLPLALSGQIVLAFGFIMQLEALWQSSRGTGKTLHQLDEQIDQLRRTTSVVGGSDKSSGRSFYTHSAEEGASPHMLLADLKGQLDALSVRIARQASERAE